MSDTRTLLAKISALRQRLDQAQGLANEARSAAAALMASRGEALPPEQALQFGTEQDLALDQAVRPLTRPVALAATAVAESPGPKQLSSRARRVLERGRDLLGQLRDLADDIAPGADAPQEAPAMLYLYRDTVAMMDTALRTVALLPDSTTAQMHLCRGLEVTLEEVNTRLRTLTSGCQRQQHAEAQIAALSNLLLALHHGEPVDGPALYALADQLLDEAHEGEPLEFLEADPRDVVRFVACHSMTVARVMARVVRQDVQMRPRAREATIAALLHDVGMLEVPADVLAYEGVLEGEARQAIEAHPVRGAACLASLFPDQPWLAEAVAAHHERIDGTGYPDGLQGNRLPPLARLLAVCDVYAALCCTRPHRPARSTRTAMADTLLLADQGQLDRQQAEGLLSLSFYPVGSVVELSHGAIGVVVATPGPSSDLSSPARPVVALLTDGHGEALARPRHLDLAQAESHTIVRPLRTSEKRELLSRRFPQWAA